MPAVLSKFLVSDFERFLIEINYGCFGASDNVRGHRSPMMRKKYTLAYMRHMYELTKKQSEMGADWGKSKAPPNIFTAGEDKDTHWRAPWH